jgi:hypothetical protein
MSAARGKFRFAALDAAPGYRVHAWAEEKREMSTSARIVEVFVAGCPLCESAVALVRSSACSSCDVEVRNLNDPAHARRAGDLGVRSVPAVALDGRLVDCCRHTGIDPDALRQAGLGSPRPG